MTTYDEIMAGVEAQAIRENIAKIKLEAIRRLEEITGQEARAQSLMDHPDLHSVDGHLENAFDDAERFCLNALVARKNKESGNEQ